MKISLINKERSTFELPTYVYVWISNASTIASI